MAGSISNRFKFLYSSVDGSYPQSPDTLKLWLALSPGNITPEYLEGEGQALYLRLDALNYVQATDPMIAEENQWKLGQNLSLTPITFGQWHRLVVHLDTSGLSGPASPAHDIVAHGCSSCIAKDERAGRYTPSQFVCVLRLKMEVPLAC